MISTSSHKAPVFFSNYVWARSKSMSGVTYVRRKTTSQTLGRFLSVDEQRLNQWQKTLQVLRPLLVASTLLRCYKCNVSHWQRPCSVIDRKSAKFPNIRYPNPLAVKVILSPLRQIVTNAIMLMFWAIKHPSASAGLRHSDHLRLGEA